MGKLWCWVIKGYSDRKDVLGEVAHLGLQASFNLQMVFSFGPQSDLFVFNELTC